MNIPFNKPFLTGMEAHYMYQVFTLVSCLETVYLPKNANSSLKNGTDLAKPSLPPQEPMPLEMAAILSDIKLGDEVTVPSYTFVSSALVEI